MIRGRALLLLLPAALIGCAAGNKDLHADISRLESNISDLRGIQAEQTTDIAALRSDLRRLNGRLEELEHQRVAASSVSSPSTEPSASLKPPPSGVPVDFLEADEVYSTSMPEEAGSNFRGALSDVRQGNFIGALNVLEHSMTVSSQQPWAPQTLFWIGVCYDRLGQPQKALSAYNELTNTFPKHSRAPAALLRQSAAFMDLKDKETAKLSLEKLIRQYPRTTEAAAARKRLQSM